MNLFIYVEGQEEEMFVNRVLRPHLQSFGVRVQKPILAATSFRIGSDEPAFVSVGGVTNYKAIREDIADLLRSGHVPEGSKLTTLIDLYALPSDFPGYSEAASQGLTGASKASHIENAWAGEVGHANFFPYIQVHEFEALVLTRPSVLASYYPEHQAGIERLGTECAKLPTPEDINETKATSPSHRIIASVPNYSKIDGFRLLQDIGLAEIKARCPRFKAWLEKCERWFA